jgi:Na+-driven multidrug efflux pump
VLSVTILGTSYQASCLTGIVRGGGNTSFVFYNDLIFMWGIVLPLSLLAAYVWKWDPVWVFFCLKSDQLMKCLVALWQVNSYRWVKKVTREDVADECA